MLGRSQMVALGQTAQIGFRAQATTSPAGTTIAKPAGVAVGDVVFVFATEAAIGGNITTTSGSTWGVTEVTWTASGLGYKTRVWWKVLNSTDAANAWVADGTFEYGAVAFIGNGASAVTVKSTTDNPAGQSSLALTGYTTTNSRGTVTILSDRDTSAATVPSGYTSRFGSVLNGNWWHGLASRIAYAGAATGTVTWTVTNGAAEVGLLLDVT